MRILLLPVVLCAVAFGQGGPKGPPPPPLAECGAHGDQEILCGTRSPEDLELIPGGRMLIVSQMVNNRGTPGEGAGITLFDPSQKTFTKISLSAEPVKDWGEAACPGPIGDKLVPHGISLAKRAGGQLELYVVNHGGRESIEMYELKQAGPSWSLVWHGCVVSTQPYNDVAAMADGGFVATHPTALQTPGMDLFTGAPSGYVSRWIPGKGESELPGTRFGYPNGVIASADGRFAYYNAWTAREVHKYDLKANREVAAVKLDFMPDNLTWAGSGRILAAGIKSARGECPAGSGTPCQQATGVAELDPAKMTVRKVFESETRPAPISGVSVALEAGNAIYIGAFQGDRLLKIPRKK
jgi:hypothetical protein